MHDFITVVGAGSWGTAIALHIARGNRQVILVTNSAAHAADIIANKENKKYIPRVKFPDNILVTDDLEFALHKSSLVLIMTPSKVFKECLMNIKRYMLPGTLICWGCKGVGFVNGEIRFFDKIVEDVFGDKQSLAVIGGPSFAKEVAQESPTAIVVATNNDKAGKKLVNALHHGNMRCYSSTDVVGVELCGVLKNVLAVAAGISDGLGLGANTRSALITRGIAEMHRLGGSLGIKDSTLMGLAGVGDIILSCTSDMSRNRRLGLGLGRGMLLQDVLKEIGQVVESVENIDFVIGLAKQYNVALPISEQVAAVVSGKVSPKQAVTALLSRESKPEFV
jgi:glycerol-3-phosphate dehydrogenase (NAD(P)+)